MVASEHLYQTIILPRKLITGSIHDYILCYCPLVGILFEVLRIVFNLLGHIKSRRGYVMVTYDHTMMTLNQLEECDDDLIRSGNVMT